VAATLPNAEVTMSTTITNKTRKPLAVPLARGKKLHLGPGKSGQIASNDAELPGLKAMVERGELEIGGESGPAAGGGAPKAGGGPADGHTAGGRTHRSGDR
jgi:hypothetical protein